MKSLLFLSFICVPVGVVVAAQSRLGLAFNEDNSHFFGSRPPSQMTREGLHAFVDQYAGTSVSHLLLCPNAMRASYDSRVWDAIWRPTGDPIADKQRAGNRWAMNAKRLAERGLDPYAVWISRSREKGLSPWLTMRMNDVHNVNDPHSYQHSMFWLQHPQYRRVPSARGGSWMDFAFDYAVPAVREHHLKLIRELLERYDLDGLELDWMRFGRHFRPDREAHSAAILTQFVREVRGLVDEWAAKREHPIKLGARVPTHPDAARGLGMDGVAWAQQGLVDMLVPSPFWSTSDFDIPLELWREQLGDAANRLVLAAGLEHGICAYPGAGRVSNTLESIRGFAAAAWHRGADQIYLFNYLDPAPIPGGGAGYRELLEKGLGFDRVKELPRRHIVTYRDTVPPGFPTGVVLPAKAHSGPQFRINIGPSPKRGRVTLIAGLSRQKGCGEASFAATMNGTPCRSMPDPERKDGLPSVARAIQFDCPLSATRDGYNDLVLKQEREQPEQEIIWVELRIDPGVL